MDSELLEEKPEEKPRQPRVKDLRHRAQSTLFAIGNEFKNAPESAVLEEASESGSDVDLEPEAHELKEGVAEWGGLLSETALCKYCPDSVWISKRKGWSCY